MPTSLNSENNGFGKYFAFMNNCMHNANLKMKKGAKRDLIPRLMRFVSLKIAW